MDQILKKQILHSEIRLIITVILCNIAVGSYAQNRNVPPPPKDVIKKVSFHSSSIKIDTIFVEELNKILFNVNNNDNWITRIPKNCRNFVLTFEEKDTLNYQINIYMDSDPCKSALGFFEYTTGFYWVKEGVIPNDIIEFISNHKKKFSYIEVIEAISPTDEGPRYWKLLYNVSTKTFKVLETNVYY